MRLGGYMRLDSYMHLGSYMGLDIYQTSYWTRYWIRYQICHPACPHLWYRIHSRTLPCGRQHANLRSHMALTHRPHAHV